MRRTISRYRQLLSIAVLLGALAAAQWCMAAQLGWSPLAALVGESAEAKTARRRAHEVAVSVRPVQGAEDFEKERRAARARQRGEEGKLCGIKSHAEALKDAGMRARVRARRAGLFAPV